MSLLKTNEIQNYNGSSLTLTASTVSTSAQLNTGGNISVTGSLNVSDDSTTRTNLGLGTIATQDSDSITVTGGTATLGALTVSGSDSGDLVRITQTGSGNALVVEDEANPDSTPFVVDSSGNVGIGTDSPSSFNEAGLPLVIGSGSGNTGASIYSGSAAYGSLYFADGTSGNALFAGYIAYNHSTNTMAFGTDSSEALSIDSSGNVGIGANPSQKLDLVGGAFIPTYMRVSNLYGSGIIGMGGANQFEIVGTSTNPIVFYTSTTERMRIDSSGNVGIGVTSISYQLQLSTDSAGKPSTTTWTIVSDERIKENIELANLELCYDAVKNIPLKRFKWRDEVYSEEQVADRHKLGWIAQDVESVYPKAVNIHEFRYNQVYNETIIPATEDEPERIEKELVSEDVIEDCRNLNADQIYAAMYGAIQKLIQNVESQQSQIDDLTAKIEALETT